VEINIFLTDVHRSVRLNSAFIAPPHIELTQWDSQSRETVTYGPAVLGTKHDCAGEGQHKFYPTNRLTQLLWNKCVAYSQKQTPPLVEEGTRFPNKFTVLEQQKFGHRSRWGPKSRVNGLERTSSNLMGLGRDLDLDVDSLAYTSPYGVETLRNPTGQEIVDHSWNQKIYSHVQKNPANGHYRVSDVSRLSPISLKSILILSFHIGLGLQSISSLEGAFLISLHVCYIRNGSWKEEVPFQNK
jgi:hypothetical protein